MSTARKLLALTVLVASLLLDSSSPVYAIRDCEAAIEECAYFFGCDLQLVDPPGCMVNESGEVYCYVECPCSPHGPELCHNTF